MSTNLHFEDKKIIQIAPPPQPKSKLQGKFLQSEQPRHLCGAGWPPSEATSLRAVFGEVGATGSRLGRCPKTYESVGLMHKPSNESQPELTQVDMMIELIVA